MVTPGPGEWWLAIDFGTSFTTTAMAVEGRIEVCEVGESRYVPSVVCDDGNGELIVGRDAVSEGGFRPDRMERVPKRALAVSDKVRLGDRTHETVDLVAAILRHVSAEAFRRMRGSAPSRVVLTHPARWQPGGDELARLRVAAGRARLPRPELLPEPVAAVHHYARGDSVQVPVGGTVAVYDFGGGTFDTAVLRRSASGYELAGPPGGDLHLGGEDLDAELMSVLAGHAEAAAPEAWDALWETQGRPAERARTQLRRDVTAVKESLSSRLVREVYVPGFDDEFRLTRGEYEAAIEPVLERSVVELLETVKQANTTPEALTDLYLTGGSSRTPRITGLLVDRLQRLPTTQDDPKAVVVLGALATAPGTGVTVSDDAGPWKDLARELTRIAASAGVGDLVGVVDVSGPPESVQRALVAHIDDVATAIARRHAPLRSLPTEVSLQLMREGRSELGEVGRCLTRLDRLAVRVRAATGRR